MERQRTSSEPSYDPALLDTLSCEIGARPTAAPHFGDVAPALRGVKREEGALLVDYDAQVAGTLAAVVEAERLCCPDLGWSVERPAGAVGEAGTLVRLRIEGTADQLDALDAAFRS